MRKWPVLSMLAIVIAIVAGCSNDAPPKADKVELLISAATSLTDSLNELKTVYERKHSNVTLTFNYGASGTLQQQIEQGAPADLFLSAGTKQMTALVDKKLVDVDQQNNMLANELVAVVPADLDNTIHKIEDLSQVSVGKIAVGQTATVPVGGYTKETLDYYKLWDDVQPKLVFAKDVRQVLTYVETGNTDIGFVYATDALTSDKVKVAFKVDPASHKPIVYPVGIVKATKHQKEASSLYDYLQSDEAMKVFSKYGFSLPSL
ncbi:molybdate ABC transporter substrate-binding protein [Paenibacillus harenae]|uniref:molybdate ABC transporter substrate-binding protein n=1 Tax=Paenibacillus harenae TaxID=306543 RepID=UPI00278FF2F1|nr:molybdate ABC transporter substrate-binding protein [Paenibacillus harenae]MDQ0058827.1 molybdate transport system substrate-binding protein [Paenibacillus harenae]